MYISNNNNEFKERILYLKMKRLNFELGRNGDLILEIGEGGGVSGVEPRTYNLGANLLGSHAKTLILPWAAFRQYGGKESNLFSKLEIPEGRRSGFGNTYQESEYRRLRERVGQLPIMSGNEEIPDNIAFNNYLNIGMRSFSGGIERKMNYEWALSEDELSLYLWGGESIKNSGPVVTLAEEELFPFVKEYSDLIFSGKGPQELVREVIYDFKRIDKNKK